MNIIEFFNDIHKKLENRYEQKAHGKREEEKVLNEFFRKIDEVQYLLLTNKKEDIMGILKENNYETILGIAEKAMVGLPGKKTTFGRKRRGKEDNLEGPFARLIRAVFQQVASETPALKSIQSGNRLTQFDYFDVREINDTEFLQRMVEQFGNEIIKTSPETGELLGFAYTNRQIKTDIQALNVELKVDTQLDSNFKKAIELLGKRSFSLKNYSSNYDIHLGSTDSWKSFSTPLLQLLGNNNNQDISRFYNIAEKTGIVNDHLNHIRFIYELSGFGQDVKDSGIQEADFLLLNKPGREKGSIKSKGIYVKSTARLINQFLEQKDMSEQLTRFSLPQSVMND